MGKDLIYWYAIILGIVIAGLIGYKVAENKYSYNHSGCAWLEYHSSGDYGTIKMTGGKE